MAEAIPQAPSRAQFLAKATIFADLAANELAQLAQRAVPRHYEAGEAIFHAGDPCSGLYIVESGFVKIFKTSMNGREQVLTIDGPGATVAELPVFDGGPYPASALAMQRATLLFISKQDFQSVCLDYPQVALKVLRVIGRRLRGLVAIIEELSFTTVRHRLAAALLRLSRAGEKTPEGVKIMLPASNQEFAAQIGTVRELVSRNMSRLQAGGIIRIDGRTVVIRDLKKLQEEVETQE